VRNRSRRVLERQRALERQRVATGVALAGDLPAERSPRSTRATFPGVLSDQPCERCGCHIATAAPIARCPTCGTKHWTTVSQRNLQMAQM
jgi:hypothetical protein